MDHAALNTALRAKVAAVWPEVVSNGVYFAVELARISFEDKAEDGELPLCLMDLDLREGEEWGIANLVMDGTLTLYYIGRDTLHVEDDLLPKLEAMRLSLRTVDLTYGQIIGDPVLNWSINLPVNAHFLQQLRPFVAGAVIARVVAGETQ